MPLRRTFLVTGCASGIGRNLADALVAAGARVVATDIHVDPLRDHAASSAWPQERVKLLPLDVTDPHAWDEAVRTTIDTFGTIDVLIGVAGYLEPAWVHEIDVDSVHRHFDINLKGICFGTRAAVPTMIERGRGHIINIASMAALAPIAGLSLYSASKYAVRAFSLAAAQELHPHGVKVTVVCPDAVRTPMLDKQRDYEQAAMTFSAPRVLEAKEVTDAILGPVLRSAPLEYFLPPSRGWLARFADIFPRVAFTVGPILRRQGQKRQRAENS